MDLHGCQITVAVFPAYDSRMKVEVEAEAEEEEEDKPRRTSPKEADEVEIPH